MACTLSLLNPFPDRDCGWLKSIERERQWHLCQAAHYFCSGTSPLKGGAHSLSAFLYGIPLFDAVLYTASYLACAIFDPTCMKKAYELAKKEGNQEGISLLQERITLTKEAPKQEYHMRTDLHQRMEEIFNQTERNYPLLIGDRGTGKTIAAKSFPGETIRIIDNIDQLSEQELKIALSAKGKVIGCCRSKGKHTPLLERKFTDLEVEQPTEEVSLKILKKRFPVAKEAHLKEAIILSKGGALPGRAVRLYDEAPNKEEIQAYAQKKYKIVTFSKEKLLGVEDFLESCVMGQDHVIKRIGPLLRNFGIGAKGSGALHFVGLTGTGKTEMAKAIAEWAYGSSENLLQVNMGEFTEPHSASTLFGASSGYVGHDKGGLIPERAKKGPFLLLLDDVHLGHPQVLKKIVQGICEEKKVLDPLTHQFVEMSQVIVVMTSNLGAEAIKNAVEPPPPSSWQFFSPTPINWKDPEVLETLVTPAIKKFIGGDEVLNRFISLPFLPIRGFEPLDKITEKFLEREKRMMQKKWGIAIEWTRNVIEYGSNFGWDLEKGVRPVRTFIAETLRDHINLFRLETPPEKGQVIQIDVQEKTLKLKLCQGA